MLHTDPSNLFKVSPYPIPLQISKFRSCEINSGMVADNHIQLCFDYRTIETLIHGTALYQFWG